jgi:hypothetical protein
MNGKKIQFPDLTADKFLDLNIVTGKTVTL